MSEYIFASTTNHLCNNNKYFSFAYDAIQNALQIWMDYPFTQIIVLLSQLHSDLFVFIGLAYYQG
jgi:hypothetical protein